MAITGSTSIWRIGQSAERAPDQHSLLYTAIFCFITAGLFYPTVLTRGSIILVMGGLIYVHEQKLGLLVPASPGFIFWFGNFFSYVLGGIGTAFLFNAWNDFGIRYLNTALLYLGLGLASYYLGIRLAGGLAQPFRKKGESGGDLVFKPIPVIVIATLFIGPVILKRFLQAAAPGSIYYNLVIGSLQSIEIVPMVLLAFYLTRSKPKWWVILLLFCATFAVPFESITFGRGRNKLIMAIVSAILILVSLYQHHQIKIARWQKVAVLISPVVLLLYFGVHSHFRHATNFDSNLTVEERMEMLEASVNQVYRSDNPFLDAFGALVSRGVERDSLELLGWVETGSIERVGWSLRDLEQVALSWVPKVFYPQKGEGYNRDVMEYYGFIAASNNVPLTVLTDTFRRSGLPGTILFYLFMGFISTSVALRLTQREDAFSLILVFYMALYLLHSYTYDALSIINFYVYRLPSSGLVIYIMLRLSGLSQVNLRLRRAKG